MRGNCSALAFVWRQATFIFLIFGSSFALQARASEAGTVAPAFDLPGPNGQIKLAQQKGRLVYLDFWASWCAPCRQSFPWMNELQSRYGSQGLQVIGINVDAKPDDASKFLEMVPAKFLIAFDSKGTTPRLYDVKGMPTSLLIDRDGKVLFQHVGFNANSKAEIEQKIRMALGEKK